MKWATATSGKRQHLVNDDAAEVIDGVQYADRSFCGRAALWRGLRSVPRRDVRLCRTCSTILLNDLIATGEEWWPSDIERWDRG